jgi:hypothetical protein
MKRLFIISGFLAMAFLGSCIKNENPVFVKSVVEYDAAAYNANAAGLTYPMLTRVPGYGRAASSTLDPALSRINKGVKKFRVNLIGGQLPTPTKVFYQIFSGTTAVEGVHYKKPSGEVTIAANSSFGEMEIEILDPGPPATPGPVDLILLLTGGENGVTSSTNYRIIGLRIAQ